MSELDLTQRTNIKFFVKLGKSGNEIREKLVQVYMNNTMKKTAVYKLVKRFFLREEKMSLTKRDQDGQQQAEVKKTLQNLRQIVRENRRLTVMSIAQQVNIDRETVRKILTEDLDKRKVCAKMVPKELTEEQKQTRVTICQDLLQRQDDISGRVITGDETWIYKIRP